MCRYRTLGCYPCTGAVRSTATTVRGIIEELKAARHSERITRVIDHDQDGSMEQKKREGYF
jgi:sulfate adenylyltransferase subunit 2